MHVYFRVDANKEIGSGHFVRCRLLANALRSNGVESTFITATPGNALAREVQGEGYDVSQLPDEAAMSAEAIIQHVDRREGFVMVVVDDHREGFHAPEFQLVLRQAGLGLMMISFRHDVHFSADIVHNQNLLALEHEYLVDDHTRLLLGPRYAILHDALHRLRPEWPFVPECISTLLVNFGGADRTNQTLKVIDALALLDAPPGRIIVVVGGLYTHSGQLKSHLSTLQYLNAELHVNTSEMPALMASSDMAISSGGLTAWELACLGVPNVILSTAEPERQTGRMLGQTSYCHYIGHFDEVSAADAARSLESLMDDHERRRRFAVRGWKLIDGRGTQRVVNQIMAFAECTPKYAGSQDLSL